MLGSRRVLAYSNRLLCICGANVDMLANSPKFCWWCFLWLFFWHPAFCTTDMLQRSNPGLIKSVQKAHLSTLLMCVVPNLCQICVIAPDSESLLIFRETAEWVILQKNDPPCDRSVSPGCKSSGCGSPDELVRLRLSAERRASSTTA